MAVAQTALDTKRYDRQIRLWGMETQLRMSTTRVLICGAGGLAAEVAKNLVLAGVGHVTLQDHARVTADDLSRGGQFLLGDAEVGASRAEASLPFLRGLNPTVTVDACTDDARAATAEHLAQFDLVIATELHFDDVLKLGALVRAARELHTETPAKRARVAAADEGGHVPARRRVHLFAAGAVGLYGWAALDLGEYVYSVTTKKKGADGEETSETSAASISYPTVEVRRAASPFLPSCGALRVVRAVSDPLLDRLRGPHGAARACGTSARCASERAPSKASRPAGAMLHPIAQCPPLTARAASTQALAAIMGHPRHRANPHNACAFLAPPHTLRQPGPCATPDCTVRRLSGYPRRPPLRTFRPHGSPPTLLRSSRRTVPSTAPRTCA